MDVEKLTVGFEKLVALPDFENVRITCSVTIAVDGIKNLSNTSSVDEAFQKGFEYCKNKVQDEEEKIRDKIVTLASGKLSWKK